MHISVFELKMALWAQNVSGTFKKQAPGHHFKVCQAGGRKHTQKSEDTTRGFSLCEVIFFVYLTTSGKTPLSL